MLLRQTLAYLPAQLIGPLAQFVAALALTHYLGAAGYGLTMLVFANQELVFLLCLSWWTAYVLRYGGRVDVAALVPGENTLLMVSALVQVAATLALLAATAAEVSPAFLVGACLFTVTRSYLGFLTERARQIGAILSYSLATVLGPLGGLVLTLVNMTLFGPSPERVLFDFALAQGAAGLGVAWRLGLLRRPGVMDRSMIGAAFGFGTAVLVSNLFGWIVPNGIRFVVEAGAGAAALGLFSVGWALAVRLGGMVAMVVAAAAYPLAVRTMEAGDPEGAKRQLSLNAAGLFALLLPTTLGVIALNEPFVRLLVGPEFQAATTAILPWAMAGAAIRNQRMHGWDSLYLLCEAPRPMVILEGVEALATLAGAAIGLWLGGLTGAAIGTTLVAAGIAVADFLFLRRRFGLTTPVADYIRLIAAGAAMYLALVALPRLGLAPRAEWGSVLGAIAYGAAVYALAIGALFPRRIKAALAAWRASRE